MPQEVSCLGIPNSPQNRRQSSALLSPSMFTDAQATCGGQQRTEHSIWVMTHLFDCRSFQDKMRDYLPLCSPYFTMPCKCLEHSDQARSCVGLTESLSRFLLAVVCRVGKLMKIKPQMLHSGWYGLWAKLKPSMPRNSSPAEM